VIKILISALLICLKFEIRAAERRSADELHLDQQDPESSPVDFVWLPRSIEDQCRVERNASGHVR
jgi:hypothetical protein